MYSGRTKEKRRDNGLIYPILDLLFEFLQGISLVEYFKKIGTSLAGNGDDALTWITRRRYSNFAVDLFIVFKFAFVMYAWVYEIKHPLVVYFVLYLLFMNTHTYFYYHVWSKDAILSLNQTIFRTRRRFVSLFTSIFYLMVTYGYLYEIVYSEHFNWSNENHSLIKAMLYSISNAFASPYVDVSPRDEIGEAIRLSQTFLMFIFVAIILGRSIPQIANTKGEKWEWLIEIRYMYALMLITI